MLLKKARQLLPFLWVISAPFSVHAYGAQPPEPAGQESSQGSEEWLSSGGPTGNFLFPGAKGLIDDFGGGHPKRLWRRPLGDGYSAILVKEGRLYTQYRAEDKEIIISLDAATGKTLWEQGYPVNYYDNMDLNYGKGPNATPLIMGNRLFTVSISGDLRCSDLKTGKLAWSLNLHERYGRQYRKEEYGFSANPMDYKGNLIIAVGGDQHGVVALNPADGSQLWGSPASRVSYAQPVIIQVEGTDQLVFFSPTEVIGMNPNKGNFLWRFPVRCFTENNLTPALQLDGRHLWVAAQLDGGSRVLKLPAKGGRGTPQVLWESKKIKQAHWNSLVKGDYIYGSFGGNSTSFLAALNWRTGEFAWKKRGFHLAKGVFADGKYYFTDENGQLAIARFSPKGAEILDAHQLLSRPCWTPPTLVGSKLYVRDRKVIMAVELKKP